MSPLRKRKRLNDPEDTGSHSSTIGQRRQLFVRGLDVTVTSDDLADHFSQSFPIKHAVAVLDKGTNHCRGYGFVTFADPEDAVCARDELNGSELRGRKIQVDIAEPRHRSLNHSTDQPTKSRGKESMPLRHSKLIIRNLPWSVKTEEQLTKLFLSYGNVKKATLPKMTNGLMAGYGFVTLRGHKNAEKALEGVNGKEIEGRTLAVDWSVDRETWNKAQKQASGREYDSAKSLLASDEDENDDDDAEEEENEDEDEQDGNEDGGHESQDETMDEASDAAESNDQKEPQTSRTTNFDSTCTLFVRNLSFTCTDEDLSKHFAQFGSVRYARIVIDRVTEKPKGTGFVCFYKQEDATACLRSAPRQQNKPHTKSSCTPIVIHSVLQHFDADPTGRYTIDGRVMNITKAVERNEAVRLTAEGVAHRYRRDHDKRKLFLLSEGTIPSNSPLHRLLSPAEIQLRAASMKQRKSLIEGNPSLHMSLTRLSVRNIPRSVSSMDLKQLARQAIVGFAKDTNAGKRSPLSRDEVRRDSEQMRTADRDRRKKGKGAVKQAKVVSESQDGTKVREGSAASRSRGYGFIEYYTHRHALMGLRWLNGHAVDYRVLEHAKGKTLPAEDIKDRKKRLIVEFAIENTQVVQRRRELEERMRARAHAKAVEDGDDPEQNDEKFLTKDLTNGTNNAGKRKRSEHDRQGLSNTTAKEASMDEKHAKQHRIIARKRHARRSRNRDAQRRC